MYGPHRIFYTVTTDDECNFNVHMLANQGNKIKLPTPNCMDSECILKIVNFDIENELDTLEHVLLITKLLCKLFVNCLDGTTRRMLERVLICLEVAKHLLELTRNKDDSHCMVVV